MGSSDLHIAINDLEIAAECGIIKRYDEDQISRDILDAMDWSAPSKLLEKPGNGEGWRHVVRRLASEVLHLRNKMPEAAMGEDL